MIWTQWLFIGIVLAVAGLVGLVVSRNPERFISRIYTKPDCRHPHWGSGGDRVRVVRGRAHGP